MCFKLKMGIISIPKSLTLPRDLTFCFSMFSHKIEITISIHNRLNPLIASSADFSKVCKIFWLHFGQFVLPTEVMQIYNVYH